MEHQETIRELICEMEAAILAAILAERAASTTQALVAISEETAADTIYAIDRVAEATIVDWFNAKWPAQWPI